MSTYEAATINQFPGRDSESSLYLRETIQFSHINEVAETETPAFALFGYACDEGVSRNKGRVGAKDGPNAIRKQLGKLANHQTSSIIDYGNLICDNRELESYQTSFSTHISALVEAKYKPIIFGGGHDVAFAHYKGIHTVDKKASIGIVNFDAHFDLRENKTPNSGTPFLQIANLVGENQFHYLPIGIRAESNSSNLFATASRLGVDFVPLHNCHIAEIQTVQKKLTQFSNQVDQLYITIDLDCFSSAFASGVSAPHPIGLTPNFVLGCVRTLFLTRKVTSVDLAEMNPRFDLYNQTAKLAASLVHHMLHFWD